MLDIDRRAAAMQICRLVVSARLGSVVADRPTDRDPFLPRQSTDDLDELLISAAVSDIRPP